MTNPLPNKKIFATFLFFAFSLFATGCESASTSQMKASEPAQHLEGDFCFRTESNEYLSLHCSNGSITGKMYLSEEYFGEIFYEFEGKFINDSVAQIRIKNDASSEPVTEKWHFIGQNKQILVLENTVRDENTAFKRINCDLLPDLTPYG